MVTFIYNFLIQLFKITKDFFLLFYYTYQKNHSLAVTALLTTKGLLSAVLVVSDDISADDSEMLDSSIEDSVDVSVETLLDTLASVLVELLLEQPTLLAKHTKADIVFVHHN